MTPFETFLRVMLWLHIAGGTISLITGLGAMFTAKGGRRHRTFGKIYFGGMTAVFVGAVVLAVSHELTFLLMVGFFSYYLTVRGYRILYLKDLSKGQRPSYIDWIITGVSAVFILFLFFWGGYVLIQGEFMGIVGLAFGLVGSSYLFQDLKNFFGKPPEKMHWWYGHIASMGGSYIAATTAFIVVNFYIGQLNFILWVMPGVIGGFLIRSTIRKYKLQFEGAVASSRTASGDQ